MYCPSCGREQADNHSACEACGLIFSKYAQAHPLPVLHPEDDRPKRIDRNAASWEGVSPEMTAKIKAMGKNTASVTYFSAKPTHLFIGAGLFALFTAYCLWGAFSFINAQSAMGVVTSWQSRTTHSSGHANSIAVPIIEFPLPGGQTQSSYATGSGFTSLLPAIGQSVRVYYKANAPYDIRINTFFDLWGRVFINAFFTALFVIAGFAALRVKQTK